MGSASVGSHQPNDYPLSVRSGGMDYRVAGFPLRPLAAYGLVIGAVNGLLLGVPVAYGVMELTRLFRPGDGTEAALVAYTAFVVAVVLGGLVSATLSGLLYNRFGGGIRLEAVEHGE